MVLAPMETRPVPRADACGVLLSGLCIVHCVALPFAVAALPALGLNWLAGGSFHLVMAALAGLAALRAFIPAYRGHGRRWVPVLGGLGILLLLVGATVMPCDCAELVHAATCTDHAHEAGGHGFDWVTPLGGLALVVGHIANHRLGRAGDCCGHAH